VRLTWIETRLGVCRLPADAPLPEWTARPAAFCSATRSPEELSVVCEAALIPEEVQSSGPWTAFKVEDVLPLNMVGVLAALLGPLADAQISVFAVSTFATDYVLVRAEDRVAATHALKGAGHEFA